MQNQIKPGLQRITRLLHGFQQRWPAIHVAGTNGKGSVCAYITAMLRHAGVRTGRFTSPHLIDRWDGITINDRVVNEGLFEKAESKIQLLNDDHAIGASSFEILTATAFHVFNDENIDMAVIECGMGGREDATNVLQHPVVSVITNVGLDHQNFLGNSVEEIAHQKAGILRPNVPFVTPYNSVASNDKVAKVIEEEAAQVGAVPISLSQELDGADGKFADQYQLTNMRLASKAVQLAARPLAENGNKYFTDVTLALDIARDLHPAMLKATFPGRMQRLSLEVLTRRKNPVLIDGAHNEDAWDALSNLVDNHWRHGSPPDAASEKNKGSVVWVLAQSSSTHKSPLKMIQRLWRPGDSVFVTRFGAVDGMPWVKPAAFEAYGVPAELQQELRTFQLCRDMSTLDVLNQACVEAAGNPLVISGSLYLISDVMRLLRDAGHDPRCAIG